MKTYEIYSVDEQGRISGKRTIEAQNDQGAIFDVRSMQRPMETQIGQRDRRVARVPPHRA